MLAHVLTRWWGARRGPELWPAYAAVFGDTDPDAWLETWGKHAAREGFRCRVAVEEDGTVVGFGYGYTGERGQWWSDQVAEALADDVVDAWVGGHFELVELGVLARARGAGIGSRVHDELLAGLSHRRALLSTSSDPADAARGLYAARGWRQIGELPWGAVVLGKELDP